MLPSDEGSLLDAVAEPVLASDATGRIAHANPAAADLFGWPAGALVGLPLTVLMPERMRDRHRAGIGRYLETHESRLFGQPVRVPALRRDGHEFEIELRLRLFRRPDGSDLILAAVRSVAEADRPAPGVLEMETRLQRRAYQLV